MIGDAVNTASRVEAATRDTGDEVLITEATRRCLTPGQFEYDERPPIALKGKAAAARVWAPRAASPLGAREATPSKVGD